MKILCIKPPVKDVPEHFNLISTHYQEKMLALISEARKKGVVLTVETAPLKPLAMGNNVLLIHARPLRNHQG